MQFDVEMSQLVFDYVRFESRFRSKLVGFRFRFNKIQFNKTHGTDNIAPSTNAGGKYTIYATFTCKC